MVRTPTIATIQYSPGPMPSDLPPSAQRYLEEELGKIAVAIQRLAEGHIDVTYAPPLKPRAGDIRYADGTQWNPGSGRGLYLHNGMNWSWFGGE